MPPWFPRADIACVNAYQSPDGTPTTLIGRDAERAAVSQLVIEARNGTSGSLVVRGEPGIGKSSILGCAARAANGFLVIQVTGVEPETEIPYAALQQVCAPMTGHLGGLPQPQAEALRAAIGRGEDTSPDRFLVGVGVLSLITEEAARRPVLCLVDDAQWIDEPSLQALAFAVRRLYTQSAAVMFGVRTGSATGLLAGLPELLLGGLPAADARRLLASAVRSRLDEQVWDQVIAEAAGNPLALLEFARALTAGGDLAGGFSVTPWVARPVAQRIADRFGSRVVALPPATRRLLLVAAADPLGDPGVLRNAATRLGLSIEDLAPAEIAGLVRLGTAVTFQHPLVRSVIYQSATAADRLAVHAALAEATDAASDPDRRTWHRGHAVLGPDEDVAADFECLAKRSLGPCGPAAAAAFLERAAVLSPDPAERARRNLAAVRPKCDAGAPGEAALLLAAARLGPLTEPQQAVADHLAARIAAVTGGGDAARLLLAAADRLAPHDASRARRAYLDALLTAMTARDCDGPGAAGSSWHEVGRAALAAPPAPGPVQPSDLLLDGLTAQAVDGYQAGLLSLRRALRALAAEPERTLSTDALGVLLLGCRVAVNLWDDETLVQIAGRLASAARDAGAVTELPEALGMAATAALLAGDFIAAESFAGQLEAVAPGAGAIGSGTVTTGTFDMEVVSTGHARLALNAWQGRLDLRPGVANGAHGYATALLHNGLGRYEEALHAALRCAGQAGHLGYALWALPELAEAAARTGNQALAHSAVERLAATTGVCGTEWGLGMLARSRALTRVGQDAEDCFSEAVSRLGRTRAVPQLARAHLLYGEWLRREKRAKDARRQLRTAREMLTAIGADGFARRADRELAATGERIRPRDRCLVRQLTPQETRIAELASAGHSNPEIASQLFISPRTVEYHLHKVFAKLEVSGRGQLHRALAIQ